ncbi:MAG: cell division protein FtsZ, partial [Candidatus Hydrogenedentes bacterium]|nr:cell division protein FtsZ [Candidatus Hydrogenedentota bacterium]
MSDELSSFAQRAVIKVCGVGGGGGNAVHRMIEDGLRDVDFITINTDAQALKKSTSPIRLQIGAEITNGLGSGARPEIGEKAAMEDRERLDEVLRGADMVFVTAGLGGGTGTGAAPLVAELARASGALTVGIVTLPFSFEGKERMENALRGLEKLEPHVDTLIVVPNDRVSMICQENVSLMDAFKQADEVLNNGVRAISELITVPGLINLDFADVRTV